MIDLELFVWITVTVVLTHVLYTATKDFIKYLIRRYNGDE